MSLRMKLIDYLMRKMPLYFKGSPYSFTTVETFLAKFLYHNLHKLHLIFVLGPYCTQSLVHSSVTLLNIQRVSLLFVSAP